MALMDTRMPLLAQAPSPVEAFSRGASAADIYNRQQQDKRKRNFLEQYGKDLFAGNTNALREYATHDLQGAMALKGHFDAKRRAAAAGSRAESKKKVQAGLDAMSVVYDEAADIEDESARAEYFQGRALEIVGQETVEQFGLTYDNFVPMATRLAGEIGLTYSAPESGDPYTLGENQTRFSGDNEIIAQGSGVGDVAGTLSPALKAFNEAWYSSGQNIGTPEYESAVKEKFLTGNVTDMDQLNERADIAGLARGTPEYKAFILADGDLSEDQMNLILQGIPLGSQAANDFLSAKEFDWESEDELRAKWTKLDSIKDFAKQAASYARVVASGTNPSAAGDLALIFNYMKVLDPGSVVRESEFAQAAATGAFGERIKAQVARVAEGERLSDVMRQDFVSRARALYAAGEAQHTALRDQYIAIAEAKGVDVSRALPDFSYVPVDQTDVGPDTPQRGDIQDGYLFLGGDAAKKENWRKLE